MEFTKYKNYVKSKRAGPHQIGQKGQLVKRSLGFKSQVPDPQSPIPDPEFQILNSNSQVPGPRFQIPKHVKFG